MRTFIVITALTALLSSVSGSPPSLDQALGLSKRIFAGPYTGQATWYDVNDGEGQPGSCGWDNVDSDYVVAVSSDVYQDSFCGRTVQIIYGSTTVTATVADECPTCNPESLDLTTGFFPTLASLDIGELDIQWSIL